MEPPNVQQVLCRLYKQGEQAMPVKRFIPCYAAFMGCMAGISVLAAPLQQQGENTMFRVYVQGRVYTVDVQGLKKMRAAEVDVVFVLE